MKATNTEVLGLGLNSGVDLGVDCSVGLGDLGDAFFTTVGESAIAGANFIREHRRYVKGGLLVAGWVGLIAAGEHSAESVPSQGIVETILNNPLGVILACTGAGAAYGAIYSTVRGLVAYREQEENLGGDATDAIRTIAEAKTRKILQGIEDKVNDEVAKEKDSAEAARLKTQLTAQLKLATPGAFAERDALARYRQITASSLGKQILSTIVAEGFEGMDVGVKLALVPLYFHTQTQANTAALLEAQRKGADFQQLMDMLLAKNAQAIGVLVLGSAALINDIKTSVQQRALQFIPTKEQQG